MEASSHSDPSMAHPHGPPPHPNRPPGSPPKTNEDDLDAALNGQEPTVKNLILAAIGVMKVMLLKSLFRIPLFTFILFCRIEKLVLIASESATGSTDGMDEASGKINNSMKSRPFLINLIMF